MLKNKVTKEVITVNSLPDLINNTIQILYQKDEYAEYSELRIEYIPDLVSKLDAKSDDTKSIKNNILTACESSILQLIKYEGFSEYEGNWDEEEWHSRIIINYKSAVKLIYDYPYFLTELKTEPVNPVYEFSENKIIYMNFNGEHPIPSEVVALLIVYNAIIEQKKT